MNEASSLPAWVEITSIEGELKSIFIRDIDFISAGRAGAPAGSIIFTKATRGHLFARESYDELKRRVAIADAQWRALNAPPHEISNLSAQNPKS